MISRKSIIDNIITLVYALIIAIIIRSLLIQPFYIPSSSMEPNLLLNIHMDIANILFHLVHQYLEGDFLNQNLKEVM